MEQPLIVQAEFSFRGGNNDELCFKKGDIITVTQREEGGWWEGTLNEKTGWFPSNYVKEYKAPLPISETIRPPEEIQEYRSVVLKDLLESEKAHVAEITGLLENFLEPLQTSQILNNDEYAQLMCNFIEVVETHDNLYRCLEECNDRVGKLFLNKAPVMKSVHQAYCAAHPRAIVVLDKYKDELEKFMERQGAASPGLLVLTTGLSKPFRRLDKYSAMLQELERHMENSHPDRGDTQRSVAVYKEIAATCSATRRQKELELQVLTGPVRGWQGQELSTLGDIIHMGSVAVGPDHRDRYFVLFPQTLLILSVSQRMSAFIYEGKLPLTGIEVRRLEDTDSIKNAFEVSGPLIEKIVAVCQGPNEANKWVELLTSANRQTLPINIKRNVSSGSINIGTPSLVPSHNSSQFMLDKRGYCARSSFYAYSLQTSPFSVTLPPKNYPPAAPYAALNAHFRHLVKLGLLRRDIVKALLYPALMNKVYDLSKIKRRKRNTKTRTKNKDPPGDNSAKDKIKEYDCEMNEDSGESLLEYPTDSECNSEAGSCETNPFESIEFFTGKKESRSIDQTLTQYETFIDHGGSSNDDQSLPKEKKIKSANCAIQIQLEENKLIPQQSIDSTDKKTESLVFGSKAVRVLNRKSSEQSIILTSTARLNIGGVGTTLKPQISELSHISSFDARMSGKMLGCENLTDLSDETQIKSKFSKTKISLESPEERSRSMPNYLVGNRFNNSDSTAVYIPTWKDCEAQNQSVDNDDKVALNFHESIKEDDREYNDEDEIHSSKIDLPAIMPAPDKLSAELLYNFDGSMTNLHRSSSHLFIRELEEPKDNQLEIQTNLNLSRENSPFKKHSINSDKIIKPVQNARDSTRFSVGRWKELEEIDFERLERDCENLENYLLMDKKFPSPMTSLSIPVNEKVNPLSNQPIHRRLPNLPSHITEESENSKSDFDSLSRKYSLPITISTKSNSLVNIDKKLVHSAEKLKLSDDSSNSSKKSEPDDQQQKIPKANSENNEKIPNKYLEKNVDRPVQPIPSSSNRANPIRRCISYQYVSMGSNAQDNTSKQGSSSGNAVDPGFRTCSTNRETNEQTDNSHQKYSKNHSGTKCKCCESSQCPSPRSSDSGMAGSCTITSPENIKFPENYYYPLNTGIVDDILEHHSNELQHSKSVSDFQTRFDVCGMFRNKFLTQSEEQAVQEDQKKQQKQQQQGNFVERRAREITRSTHQIARGRSADSATLSGPLTIHTKSIQVQKKLSQQTEKSDAEKVGVFKTGLYAHWWKKENLPLAVVRGIIDLKSREEIPESNLVHQENSNKIVVKNENVGNQISEPTTSSKPTCSSSTSGDRLQLMPTSLLSTRGGVSGSGKRIKRMSPPASLGTISHQQQQSSLRNQQQTLLNQTSQHKRSLSFNHHLSYNQYSTLNNQQHQQHLQPLHQHQQQQQIHQGVAVGPAAMAVTQATTAISVQGQNLKSNLVQTSKNISKMENPMQHHQVVGANIAKITPIVVGQSGRAGSIKANWSITNLQPAPPLRPNLLNVSQANSTGSGASSVNNLANYCNSRKIQPTYEEDALVLRVIEAYCAAYQSNSRNTIHSALQPWTPCLPIRGGKLQTTRAFSTSNPQLPFLCSGPGYDQPFSNNSLNSSYIWREASPNNFNMYSASVSSLNTAYRYSLGGVNATPGATTTTTATITRAAGVNIPSGSSTTAYCRRISDFNRSASEERHPQSNQNQQHHIQYIQPQAHQQRKNFMNAYRFKSGSGYDNIFMTPLLPRKNKQAKGVKTSYQTHQRTPPPPTPPLSLSRKNSLENRLPLVSGHSSIGAVPAPGLHPGLYDRRLNRSFETPQGYVKTSTLRRSTPHLPGEDECMPTSIIGNNHHHHTNHDHDRDSRHSAIQCCGNFVMKQWRKINHHY